MPGTTPLPCADILRVHISASPSREERIRDYLSEVGDPNHFFCGPVEVQVRFNPHGSPLREVMNRCIGDL